MNFTTIESTLIVLMATLAVSVVFRLIHLPVVLGYLVVGCMIGPHVLGWLPDTQDIKELAEIGVALLMFTIGLEFSLSRLIAMRFTVFVLGGLQVFGSILVTVAIGMAISMSLVQSIVVGCIVAMSSTAVVIKQLSEQDEIESKHGLNAISILLFQDLAVIPILILIGSLSGSNETNIINVLLLGLLKGVAAVIIIIAGSRWLLRPLFHMIVATRVIELFTLSVLFVALGTAWLTNSMGASYALGTFLAGIILGETEFRHQINREIRPFRDVLLGLFFVSIGMLVDVTAWLDTWLWISLLVTALIIGKTLSILLLCRIFGNSVTTATRTGLILAQGGEFGFAILTLALANKLIPVDYGQVVLAALLISLALSPLIIRFNEKIATLLFRRNAEPQDSTS